MEAGCITDTGRGAAVRALVASALALALVGVACTSGGKRQGPTTSSTGSVGPVKPVAGAIRLAACSLLLQLIAWGLLATHVPLFFEEAASFIGWLDVSPTPDGQVAELEHRATEAGLLAIH